MATLLHDAVMNPAEGNVHGPRERQQGRVRGRQKGGGRAAKGLPALARMRRILCLLVQNLEEGRECVGCVDSCCSECGPGTTSGVSQALVDSCDPPQDRECLLTALLIAVLWSLCVHVPVRVFSGICLRVCYKAVVTLLSTRELSVVREALMSPPSESCSSKNVNILCLV